MAFREAENIIFAKESILRDQRLQFFTDFENYGKVIDIQLGLRDNLIDSILSVIFGESGKYYNSIML